jgi:hypothetical protein
MTFRRYWSRWTDALVIVKPATVNRLAPHRGRLHWRGVPGGRPKITDNIRVLIRRLAKVHGWAACIIATLAKGSVRISSYPLIWASSAHIRKALLTWIRFVPERARPEVLVATHKVAGEDDQPFRRGGAPLLQHVSL